MNSFRDDDLAREVRAELRAGFVPFDPALAQQMIDTSIAATFEHEHSRARWAMPLLASGAVAAVVGGIAGVSALHPGGHHVVPGGGPTGKPVPKTGVIVCSASTYNFPSATTVPLKSPPPSGKYPSAPAASGHVTYSTTPPRSMTIEVSPPASRLPASTGVTEFPAVCKTLVPTR